MSGCRCRGREQQEQEGKRIWFCAYRQFITCRLLYENDVFKRKLKIEQCCDCYSHSYHFPQPITYESFKSFHITKTKSGNNALSFLSNVQLMNSTGATHFFFHIFFLSSTILLSSISQYTEGRHAYHLSKDTHVESFFTVFSVFHCIHSEFHNHSAI